MAGTSDIERAARRRQEDLQRRIAEEIRALREDAGLSQAELARAAGISPSQLSRIEACRSRATIGTLAGLGAVLGADLSVRFYPNTGPIIRDRFQARMIEALLAPLHQRWVRFVEVGVRNPVRGVIDVVLADPPAGVLVAAEAQSELRRLEQLIRWQAEKASGLGWTEEARLVSGPDGHVPTVSRLLLVRSTRDTREIANTFPQILTAAYPARPADIFRAVTTADGAWPGSGILWVSVDGRSASLMDGPPRRVALGR